MRTSVVGLTEQPAPAQPEAPGFGRVLYPMRIIGVSACILIAWLYISSYGTLRRWDLVVLALALAYPHVSRYLAERAVTRRKVELGTVLVDAFVLGSTIYVTGFSPIPLLSLLTVALANGMALGSVRFMGLSAVCAFLGMGLPTLLHGANYAPQDHFGMNVASAVFLLVYFNNFAWVAYRRSVLLQKSRLELRQQKLAVEIEKKKSDSLLLAIVPAPAAAELERRGTLEPQRHEEVTLVTASIDDFRSLVEEMELAELVADLNYCFKAFDQIVLRHRLEPLTASGGTYVAVGGVPARRPDQVANAVGAALEMRDFARRLRESRRATGRPDFAVRLVVHSGEVVSSLLETRKLSFDLWGSVVDEGERLQELGGAGEVVVSEAVLSQVKTVVTARPGGKFRSDAGDEVPAFLVERSRGS